MTESEALQTLAILGETAGTYGALYFSVTFAYITVAYLVGNTLSKFESIAVSILYLLSASLFGGCGYGYSDAWIQLSQRERTIMDNVWIFREATWLEGIALLLISVTSLSLYYMYNLRRQHTATHKNETEA